MDERAKRIARKLRKIRELKGLTREKFCEPLGENSDYWGLIERGEQPINQPAQTAPGMRGLPDPY